jgi:O-antigen/teichoic acid export membrane protein
MVYMDRFYLAAARSPAQVTEYVAAYELASKILLLPALVIPVFFPVLIQARLRDTGESNRLLLRLALSLALACAIPTALLAIAAPELVTHWLKSMVPPSTTAAVQILCGGVLVNCLSQAFFLQVQTLGRTRAIAMVHLGVLPGYVLLLSYCAERFGTEGVALAWALRVLVDASLFCWLAGATLAPSFRGKLWRVFLVTVGFGLGLGGLTLVPTLWGRGVILLGPLLLAMGWRKQIFGLVKEVLPAATWLARQNTQR